MSLKCLFAKNKFSSLLFSSKKITFCIKNKKNPTSLFSTKLDFHKRNHNQTTFQTEFKRAPLRKSAIGIAFFPACCIIFIDT